MSRSSRSQPADEPTIGVSGERAPPAEVASTTPAVAPTPAGTGQLRERRYQQRPDGPRRVRDGLKLSSREGPVARHPLAERWMHLIASHVPADMMSAGLEYARAGQIVSLHALPGEVEAHVQGTAARPYVVRIGVPVFDEESWQRVIEAMAIEAIHHAKLLAGELPSGVDATLAKLNLSLLPDAASVSTSCTCAAGAACKHVAAAAAMFADQLSNEPPRVFSILGLPTDRLIERLRQARAIHTHGIAAAHTEADIPGSQVAAQPLEASLDDFWHGASEVEAINWQPPAGAVPHALLRRMGPSPLQGRFPMVGLLASIYDAVAQEAKSREAGEAPGQTPSAQ